MLSAVIVSALVIGQNAPTPPLQKYTIRCQFGHPISIPGYLDKGQVHAILGAPIKRPATPAPQGGSAPAAPPVAPKTPAASAPAAPVSDYMTHGIPPGALDQLPAGKSWYGGNVTTAPAVGATGEPPNRVHVTIIGSEAEREAARADLEADPEFRRIAETMGDLLAVQDYGPENPLVKNVGLVDGGKPDIIIQTTAHPLPLYRAHEYPGSDVLVGEIRKADPRYDPSQDPDGTGGAGLDLGRLFQLPSTPMEWAIVAGVGLVLWFLIKD